MARRDVLLSVVLERVGPGLSLNAAGREQAMASLTRGAAAALPCKRYLRLVVARDAAMQGPASLTHRCRPARARGR